MRAASAFDCTTYKKAEYSFADQFKVALPKGIDKKVRPGSLPQPHIPGNVQTYKGCKIV